MHVVVVATSRPADRARHAEKLIDMRRLAELEISHEVERGRQRPAAGRNGVSRDRPSASPHCGSTAPPP